MGMSLIVFMIICFNNIFLYTYIYHFFNLFKTILYLIFRSIIICVFNFKYLILMKLAFSILIIWIEFLSVLSWAVNAHTVAEYYMKSGEVNDNQPNNTHYEEFPDFTDEVYIPGIHDDIQKTNKTKIPITSEKIINNETYQNNTYSNESFQNESSWDSSSDQSKTYEYENNTKIFESSNNSNNQGTFTNENEQNITNQTEFPNMNETLYPEETINGEGNETKQINNNNDENKSDISSSASDLPSDNLPIDSIPQISNESLNNDITQDSIDNNKAPLHVQNTSASHNNQSLPSDEKESIHKQENETFKDTAHPINDQNNNEQVQISNKTNESHEPKIDGKHIEENKEKKNKHHHHKKKKLDDYQNEMMQKMFDKFLQYTNQLIQNKPQMEQEKLKNDTKTIIITSSTDTKIDSKNENTNYSHNKIIINSQPKKTNRKKLK